MLCRGDLCSLVSIALFAILFIHSASYLNSLLLWHVFFMPCTSVYSIYYKLLCCVLLVDLNFEIVETEALLP